MTNKQILDIFSYHAPSGTQPERYGVIRAHALDMAITILGCCPDSPEKRLAITNLRQAVMWANAAIAINENPVPVQEQE